MKRPPGAVLTRVSIAEVNLIIVFAGQKAGPLRDVYIPSGRNHGSNSCKPVEAGHEV